MAGLFVDQLVLYLLLVALKFIRRGRTFWWPVVMARTTGSVCERPSFGCYRPKVYYEYWVDGRRYRGIHTEPFLRYRSGWHYSRSHESGAGIKLRVKRSDPWNSVVVE